MESETLVLELADAVVEIESFKGGLGESESMSSVNSY